MHTIESLWASSTGSAVSMLGTVCLVWLSPRMWLLPSLALSGDRTLLGEAQTLCGGKRVQLAHQSLNSGGFSPLKSPSLIFKKTKTKHFSVCVCEV